MSTENPYQSPDADSIEDNRAFRQFPTWKFWALMLVALPWFVTQFFGMKFDLGNPIEENWFDRNVVYIFLGGLVFASCSVYGQWPTSDSHYKAGQKFTCVVAIFGLSAIATICLLGCVTISLYVALTRGSNWGFSDLEARLLSAACGVISSCIPLFFGVALAFDAVGRPLRWKSMFAKLGIPRLR
jgi:hypothetical protein